MKNSLGLSLLFAVTMLLSTHCSARDAEAEKREKVLGDAIEIVSANAYNAAAVDWLEVKKKAFAILKLDNSENGLKASLFFVVSKLKDGHSSYVAARTSSLPSTSQPSLLRVKPISELVANSASYPVLKMNSWMGREAASARAATEQVRSTLSEAVKGQDCGLIVDFSSNSGGNMWPMVIGLLPLLSDGVLGAFEAADGVRTSIVSAGEIVLLGGKPHYLNFPPLPVLQSTPKFVALIIGQHTASSGEISALMFKGQDNTRFFGAETSGHSSANRGFPLDNGGTLFVTTAATIDRNGEKYFGSVLPDAQSETPLVDATEWLNAQCKHE